jgi:succinate-semialdehyde dehydrogenase / glutarate-semialdehyde dehydrogenase
MPRRRDEVTSTALTSWLTQAEGDAADVADAAHLDVGRERIEAWKGLVEDLPHLLLIGGEWREAVGGAELSIEDPGTGEHLCQVADAQEHDATAAIDAAARAQDEWAKSSPAERAEILERAHVAISGNAEELARVVTLEAGKPIAEARAEVEYAADFFRWFAGEALRIEGYFKLAADARSRVLVMRQPVGPCYLITPWNFPMAMAARKIAPAIAAGCTMVIKPAEQTPLSTLALADLLASGGLPPGVLNVVTTSSPAPVSAAVMADRRLRKISFTGSTEVGRMLIAQSAQHVLNVSMELGGNSPFLVFADADLDQAVSGALQAKMRNIGQSCTAANRFYVEESVAEEFTNRLAARMANLIIGHGAFEDVEVGPMIDRAQLSRLGELVADAVDEGAKCVVGGKQLAEPGYYFEPTVLTAPGGEARLWREEIFGPVAPVVPFASEEEAVPQANASEHGLAAYVFTRDVNRAFRVSEALETGIVGLNRGLVSNAGAPFGGMKASGIGREGGSEGIEAFLEPKYVALG